MHLAQCRSREDVAGRSGHAQAVPNVGDRLLMGQGIEVVASRNALRELAQLVAGQQLAQLRLSDEDDLQQLLRVGLEIGEEPYLLEHLRSQILSLIDHEHDAAAVAMGTQQIVTEDVDEILEASRRRVRYPDAELLADREQELGRG